MTILIFLGACQTAPALPTPTPSATPAPTLAVIPTQTPRPIQPVSLIQPVPAMTNGLSAAPTLPPTIPPTRDPFFIPAPLELTATTEPSLIAALDAVNADPAAQLLGYSVEGRPITAHRVGVGANVLLLVGGMHGGWEANTVQLMLELLAYFRANPASIPASASVVIVPVVNPDGLLRGRSATGRFNANGIDLNRNWGCDWRPEAVWRDRPVNAGVRAFSEPESLALGSFIQGTELAGALFYHSAASGIFAGQCGGDHGSAAFSAVYGEAAGYTFGQSFTAYPVSGTAAAWTDGQGIPAADVELATSDDSEFERNLPAVLAVLELIGG